MLDELDQGFFDPEKVCSSELESHDDNPPEFHNVNISAVGLNFNLSFCILDFKQQVHSRLVLFPLEEKLEKD